MPGKQKNSHEKPSSPVSSPCKSPERQQFNVDDPDYIRDLQRPAVIKEDLNEMERRKRVRQILESKAFREELEQLIQTERNQENSEDRLKTLERLSELILPQTYLKHPSLYTLKSQFVLPIADLRGSEATKYSKQERILRNKLACLYRLIDLFQWNEGIYNHISVRLANETDAMLINPLGLFYHEITASSLVKINMTGRIVDPGTTGLGVNEAGYVLHSAIYQARPDIRCVIHLHTPACAALVFFQLTLLSFGAREQGWEKLVSTRSVAAMKCGLLPISQEAMIIGNVSYHDYNGIVVEDSERSTISCDLGANKVMFLRNHGFVACGTTVAEAFHLVYNLVLACDIQVRAVRVGVDNLIFASEDAQQKVADLTKAGGGGVNKQSESQTKINWKIGELEFEAWMRVLDNAGFRTGHIYRHPISSSRPPQQHSDIMTPPAASSRGLLDENESAAMEGRMLQGRSDGNVWLNSPNIYTRKELKETGTQEPKTYTKWVQEMNTSSSNPVKISSPHQFAPISSNSKEFKEKRDMLKEARRVDTVSAGPQSKVLEPVTWQEIDKLKEAELNAVEEKVIIGAASKGIIERDFRHNAQIYQQLYQPNPFASETDEDIKAYLKEVEKKREFYDDHHAVEQPDASPSPESVSLMLAARDHHAQPYCDETPTSTGRGRVTTFDASSDRTTTSTANVFAYPKLISDVSASTGNWLFHRSKSDRFHRSILSDHNTTTEEKAFSEDESRSSGKKDKKKKKFKPASFFSRGKKEKKKSPGPSSDISE
ncbi:Adducin-related protein 1 [Trichinella murrelli]|uniref:Adducin-related protein 1 n=1 Tax=Trichinella murrelli TaxID=144512 RepID=A0A0V0TBW4_9BILA|nr:Adducin-related protein 1 [Trichinella murrelli]